MTFTVSPAVISVLSSSALYLALGAFGSLVEQVGKVAQSPRVESAGRALESIAADLPKLKTGVVNVWKGLRL